MSKDSIIILTSSFPRWANDTDPPFVYHLAQRLSDSFNITVLAPHCHGAERYEKFDNLNVVRFKYFIERYQKLAYQGGVLSNLRQNALLYLLIPFFILFELIALVCLIKKLNPKVLHAHWVIPQGLVAVIACRLVKHPPRIICTAHGADIYGLRGYLFEKLKRFSLLNTDVCTVVSNALKKDVRRISGENPALHVIPMGVQLSTVFTESKIPPLRNQLLFVGRLVEKKGLHFLLEAMPKILSKIPDATLQIIGDGHKKMEYIKYVNENKLEKSVFFLGAVNNLELPKYYQASEILIFPSIVATDGDQEGLGLVPIEAMGCGCGVVATDLEAIRDVVQDKVNGLVVSQRSPAAIATAVVHLLENRSLLEQCRREGRRYVRENFDWSVVSEKYRSVINRLIAA